MRERQKATQSVNPFFFSFSAFDRVANFLAAAAEEDFQTDAAEKEIFVARENFIFRHQQQRGGERGNKKKKTGAFRIFRGAFLAFPAKIARFFS